MAGITNEIELYNLAKRLNIHIDGIYPIEKAYKIKSNGSYIILLHRGNHTGHWVAFYRGQYFDSFGEPPPLQVPFVKSYSKKQFQSINQEFCGWWCLLFLFSKQKKRPKLLNQMVDISFE